MLLATFFLKTAVIITVIIAVFYMIGMIFYKNMADS